jgi:hypothetical protein
VEGPSVRTGEELALIVMARGPGNGNADVTLPAATTASYLALHGAAGDSLTVMVAP